MNTNELRLGNWIWSSHGQYDRIESKVTAIHLGYVNTSYDNSDSDLELRYIEPIPLTEEWLLKFGFDCFDGGIITSHYIDVTGITMAQSEVISLAPNNDRSGYWYVYFRQGDTKERELFHTHDLVLLQRKLEHVHQLQNLYFALTGEELTIKDQ